MINNILIVPVGLEKDRILISIQKIPINKIYLLTDTEINGEKDPKKQDILREITRKFFSEIKAIWKPTFGQNLITKSVKLSNIDNVIEIIGNIISSERKNDPKCQIYVNISTATKIFAVICSQIASIFPKNVIPFYLSTRNYLFPNQPNYDSDEETNQKIKFDEHGLTTGPYKMIEIPVLPIIELKSIAKNILINLHDEKRRFRTSTVKDICDLLGKTYEKQSERRRVTYWCVQLKKRFFLSMNPKNKGYDIQITSAGSLFIQMLKGLGQIT